MRGVLLAIAALAGGCNAAFGLDPVGRGDGGTIDAVSDRDGDGVNDVVDRCPDVADPRQHDEDGDGVGDLCDNCPHVPNADQADLLEGGSADGIGDNCDPNPDVPGDLVAWFDAFDDDDRDPRWATENGAPWVETDDALVQTNSTGVHILAAPSVTGPRLTAEIGLTITASPLNVQRGVHLALDYTSEQSAVLCTWRSLASATTGEALALELRPATQSVLGMATAPAVVEMSTQRLRARRTIADTVAGIRCELVGSTNLGGTTTTLPGGLALRTNNLGVRIEYLMVYDRMTSARVAPTD